MRTLVAGILVTLLSASPVFAESRPHTRAATITKWALIGAGAGFGIGFLQGAHVWRGRRRRHGLDGQCRR